ncbi:MAG: protein translocase subunit SecF [bacterium]|nr:protein translocase subunit SecF [bacterium]
MIQIFKNTKFNFIGIRKYTYALSGALIIMGIVSIITHRGLKYGIDFTGGSIVELRFEQPIETGYIRENLSKIGLGDAVVQKIVTELQGYYLIKTVPKEGVGEEIANLFNPRPTVEREELVGPSVSQGFKMRAVLVVLLGWIMILIYVAIRFTFRWGVTAVVALIHDVLVTVAFISIFDKEVNIPIVAALLTIIGYSINDSIVVADRVRENLRILKKNTLPEIINISVNQTLARTVLTSFTLLCVLIAIFLFGGRVIHDFAFALIVGTISGIYSTVYIMSALVVAWERVAPSKLTKR